MDAPHSLSILVWDVVAPLIGQPVWGAKQGYGSFLDLEFDAPKLIVKEWQSGSDGLRRQAYVRGRWHIWIYCCAWRFTAHGEPVAWSEDIRDMIARATAMLDGQKLSGLSLDPQAGTSRFTFDLGAQLETWPADDDPTVEQWYIYGPESVFAYRADGRCSLGSGDTPPKAVEWFELA
ncbi:hypothetical protein ABIC65_003256 [Sphingomonas trueperi]|uniref:hypothetical protein n=1 Tax=Sphingomonas trueperi TaxID=53317 RepID=UPI0033976546